MKIPVAFKDKLGDGFAIVKGAGNYLSVLPKAEAERRKEIYNKVPPTDLMAIAAVREINLFWDEPEPDSQSRFVLNQRLRSVANITKEMVIIGMGSWLEIWSKEEVEKPFAYTQEEKMAALAKYE
jgi:MraZ protein